MNIDKINNYCHARGNGSFSDIFGIDPLLLKGILKDISIKDMIINIRKDSSKYYKNTLLLKFVFKILKQFIVLK